MMKLDRRMFLRSAGLGALASGWSSSADAGVFFWKRLFSVPPRDTVLITPNEKFYIVSYSGYPAIDLGHWSLYIGGRVGKPLRLTYADFYGRPTVEMAATLICIDTLPGADTISNAVWRGVPLRDLLFEAGIDSKARKVIFKSADGYTDSITLTQAMTGDVMLAYFMNGTDLPPEHGHPLRAIVPGIYGMKNVKWIMEIEVTQSDYLGYWQQRGWSDEAVIGIMSRIDRPGAYQELVGLKQEIRGIAFAGSAGIARVEVSTDGGRTWNPGQLDPPLSAYTWVFWHFDWDVPRPGNYRIIVRATDRSGHRQIEEYSKGFPTGSTGLHAITVEVVLPT